MLVSRILQASGGSLLIHGLCINRTAVRSEEKAKWIRLFPNNWETSVPIIMRTWVVLPEPVWKKKSRVLQHVLVVPRLGRQTDFWSSLLGPISEVQSQEGPCINKQVDSAWGTALNLVSDIQSRRMCNIKTLFWVLSLEIFSSYHPTELWMDRSGLCVHHWIWQPHAAIEYLKWGQSNRKADAPIWFLLNPFKCKYKKQWLTALELGGSGGPSQGFPSSVARLCSSVQSKVNTQ